MSQKQQQTTESLNQSLYKASYKKFIEIYAPEGDKQRERFIERLNQVVALHKTSVEETLLNENQSKAYGT